MDLEEMLKKERKEYIYLESFVRQVIVPHIRGLSPSPTEREIEIHLKFCKDYYTRLGTKDGDNSPWITARRSEDQRS